MDHQKELVVLLANITNRGTFGKLQMPFFYFKYSLSSFLRRVFPASDVFHGLNVFCDFSLLLSHSPKRKKKKKNHTKSKQKSTEMGLGL